VVHRDGLDVSGKKKLLPLRRIELDVTPRLSSPKPGHYTNDYTIAASGKIVLIYE